MIVKKSIQEISKDSRLYQEMVGNHEYYPNKIQYENEYSQNTYENVSFALSHKDDDVLVVLATLKENEFGFYGQPLEIIYNPASLQESRYLANEWLRNYFVEFIETKKIQKMAFYPNSQLVDLFLDKSLISKDKFLSYVDLSLSEDLIKKSIRKSYRSLINWGKRELKLVVLDGKNYNQDEFELFRQFHIQVAGRETRSVSTWNKQFDMIKSGEAFLILGYWNEKLVSSILCAVGLKEAYYWVGVSDRELMAENKPLQHIMIYEALVKSKELGVKEFILGEILNKDFNEKEAAIAKFKKGFTSTVKLKSYLVASFKND